jgi:acetyl esterase/lipase
MFKSWARRTLAGRNVGPEVLQKKNFLANVFILDDEMKHKKANLLEYQGITEENDIQYSDANIDACKLDVLYNKELLGKYIEGKYPILFNIHGGGWIAGDKLYRRGFCMQFANEGFFVVNINYGLSPMSLFPEPFRHINYAMNWVYDNAEKYNLDLDNFFITGDSAGGHLASMAIAIEKSAEYREKLGIEEPKVKIKKAILNSAVLYPNKVMFLPIMDMMIKSFVPIKNRKEFETAYDYKDYVSFVKALDVDFPEIMFVTATQDFATRAQNKAVIKTCKEKGLKFRQFDNNAFMNRFHCFHLKIWMPGANRAQKESIRFLLESLTDSEETLKGILTYKEYRARYKLEKKYLSKLELIEALPDCPDRTAMINSLNSTYQAKKSKLLAKQAKQHEKYEKTRLKRFPHI